jgi:hypothetical protein
MTQITQHSVAQVLLLAEAVRSVQAENGLLALAISAATAPLAMGGKGCDKGFQALQTQLNDGIKMK